MGYNLRNSGYNLNIIRKMAINVLKLLDMGIKNLSLKNKRYMISMNSWLYLERVLEI